MLKEVLRRFRPYRALSYLYDLYLRHESARDQVRKLRHIGTHSQVNSGVEITDPSRVWIGDWTKIYGGTFINSSGGVHIGNHVGIGFSCTILTFIHSYRNATAIPFDNHIQLKPVVIRDFAWIGWHAKLLPGIEIGEGAIVSMGAVVTKNVPPLAIVMGNPAEVIGYRSEKHFSELKAAGKVASHKLGDFYPEGIIEEIPIITRRRYAKELADLGMLDIGASSASKED